MAEVWVTLLAAPVTAVGAFFAVNVAVTARSELIITVQVPVPEQPAPDQPANVELESGLAVSVTIEPAAKLAEHLPPQSIPDGELVTVPEPDPFFDTVNVCSGVIATPNGFAPAPNGEPETAVNPPPEPIVNADTLPEPLLVTYKWEPSGLTATPTGPPPAANGEPETALNPPPGPIENADTLPEPLLAT